MSAAGFWNGWNLSQREKEVEKIVGPLPELDEIVMTSDFAVIRPEEGKLVVNATNMFPSSARYSDLIVGAKHAYERVFDIPLEILFSMYWQESRFDALAFSSVLALGIGQIMRFTAVDLGLNVYTRKKDGQLYTLEKNVISLSKKSTNLRLGSRGAFDANKFDRAEELKLKFDKAQQEKEEARAAYLQRLQEIVLNSTPEELAKFDGRLSPELAIPASVRYLAILTKYAQQFFKAPDHYAIELGLASYNAGWGNVRGRQGIPKHTEKEFVIHFQRTNGRLSDTDVQKIRRETYLVRYEETRDYVLDIKENALRIISADSQAMVIRKNKEKKSVG